MADATSIFNYELALQAVKDNPFGKEFLQNNRDRLVELGTEAGQAILLNIVALFAAGRNRAAWEAFYGQSRRWAILGSGAAEDAAATADMAKRWSDLGDFLSQCGVLATKAMLTVLVAGFCG